MRDRQRSHASLLATDYCDSKDAEICYKTITKSQIHTHTCKVLTAICLFH